MAAGGPNNQRIIPLEEGWTEIKTKGIDKLENILNGDTNLGKARMFGHKEYMAIYTTCYDMSTQRSPYDWSRELYQRHGETIENYLRNTVLPALQAKSGQGGTILEIMNNWLKKFFTYRPALQAKSGQGGTILLTELQHRWSNHEIMNKWLKMFFTYLDRYYVKHHSLPSLIQVGLHNFHTHIYEVVKHDATRAILDLINDEREGKIIDKTLVKSIVELYENMGMGSLDAYNADLEEPLLNSTREYYAKKRQEWIDTDSTHDYLIKARAALKDERNRVGDYLNPSSGSKLLNVCKEEILEKALMVLLEKKGSGCGVRCGVLLANDKPEGSQRRFRLVFWRKFLRRVSSCCACCRCVFRVFSPRAVEKFASS